MARRAFVVGMIRRLRQFGPLPRRRRIPRQQQPDLIRLEYYKALLPFVHEATNAMDEWKSDILYLLMNERRRQGKFDDFAEEAAREFVQRARAMAERALEQSDLESVVQRFARRTSEFQRGQLDRQVVAALSVQLSMIEEPVRERIGAFIKENVDLIKSVHARYFDRIESDVREAFERGTHPNELAEMFVERDGMAERDARRIARDQIGKLNAEVNEERQKGLGLTSYIWRTVNDQRVREEHQDREGRQYKWSNPPTDGHPGEAIQCFPGDSAVSLFKSRIEKIYRRSYTGPVVMMSTATGEKLRATPNHPVLTGRGWLAAHLVEVGDYVFKAGSQGRKLLVHDPQRGDATLEQLFRAATLPGISHRVATLACGFHGDSVNQQVDVIDIDRGLMLKADASLSESFCQQVLSRANQAMSSLGGEYLLLLGPLGSPAGIVSGAGKLLALVAAESAVSLEHGGGSISWLKSIANDLAPNGCAADAESLRYRLDALPAGMERRHLLSGVVLGIIGRAIVDVPRLDSPSAQELGESVALRKAHAQGMGGLGDGQSILNEPLRVIEHGLGEFEGHVYNLETSSGWYVTQNLIVHNCRCFAEPVFDPIIEDL